VRKLLLAALASGLIAYAFSGCNEPSEPSILNVKYQVIGSADSIDIIFKKPERELFVERPNASPPWDYSFQAEAGEYVFVSGRNRGESGSVCVRIWREGKIFRSSTCVGARCEASASGNL
jgi:hypothetical protein